MQPIIANIHESNPRISRISWGGIIAGAFTIVAILFILNLLGLGIGLTAVEPNKGVTELTNIRTGTIIWWTLSNLAAIFIGGMVAARMAGYSSSTDGGLHGFLAWAVYTVGAFVVFSSAIGLLFTGLDRSSGSLWNANKDIGFSKRIDRADRDFERHIRNAFDHVKKEYYLLVDSNFTSKFPNSSQRQETNKSNNSGTERTNRELTHLYPGQMYSNQNLDLYFNPSVVRGNRKEGSIADTSGERNYFDERYFRRDLHNRTNMSGEEIDRTLTRWRDNIDKNITSAQQYYEDTENQISHEQDMQADKAGKYGILMFVFLGIGALAGFAGGALGSPSLYVSEEHRKELIEQEKDV